MSSGQKAWEEDAEQQAYTAHCERLTDISPSVLVGIVDSIHDSLVRLEGTIGSLPRSGWYYLDKVKEEVRKLR